MNQITLRAAAKLNFTLDITGTRPDGYHRLRMVMQSVSVYDTLALQKSPCRRRSWLRPKTLPGKRRRLFLPIPGLPGAFP